MKNYIFFWKCMYTDKEFDFKGKEFSKLFNGIARDNQKKSFDEFGC